MTEPVCAFCHRKASDIPELVDLAEYEETEPPEFARQDGTYNRETNQFACDECYVGLGAPSSPIGWKAP